jgi:myo-inositol-1(or 4)-monophosphatase
VHSANDERTVGDGEQDAVIELFGAISDRARETIAGNVDWAESGVTAGQYNVDVALDRLCVDPLLAAGYDVLSEETGIQRAPGSARPGIVVVDPLDGSTNASLGLPWFATSLCWIVAGVPTAAMVTNLATGERFGAAAGRGARRDGQAISVAAEVSVSDAVLAISGLPDIHYGWRQFRAMGASALDICAVARGAFDGFVDMSTDAHGVWDYAGAVLVLREAGGVVADAFGRDLIVLEHGARRTPVAASSAALFDELLEVRSRRGGT